MGYYGVDQARAVIEITPACEEVMKILPLLFYLAVFEPEQRSIVSAAIGISVGFATFENVCYLTENGAQNFSVLLIRGISAGALHILCGIAICRAGCGAPRSPNPEKTADFTKLQLIFCLADKKFVSLNGF